MAAGQTPHEALKDVDRAGKQSVRAPRKSAKAA